MKIPGSRALSITFFFLETARESPWIETCRSTISSFPLVGAGACQGKYQPLGEDKVYAMARMLCSLQVTQSTPHPQGHLPPKLVAGKKCPPNTLP